MKYTITHLNCRKASRSWIIDVEARFPTKLQSTWETDCWTSEGVNLGNSLFIALITMFWRVRVDIKERQALPGEFKLK